MKRWNATFSVWCVAFGFVGLPWVGVAWGQSQEVEPPAATGLAPRENTPVDLLQRAGPPGRRLTSGGFQFEVTFADRSVEILAFDQAGAPVQLRDVRGRVVFALPGDRRIYRYDLYAPAPNAEKSNRLYLALDLSHVPDRGVSVEIVLNGLDQKPVEFALPFQRTLSLEQIAILRQRVCPVSGKLLGSMGQPPKVTIDKHDVFVCCQGCIRTMQERPELYLSKITAADSETLRR